MNQDALILITEIVMDQTIELRTEDGIFTEEFFEDERITGKFARAAATQELQNLRFDTADTAATSVAQSFDFMLSGLSKLDENGDRHQGRIRKYNELRCFIVSFC